MAFVNGTLRRRPLIVYPTGELLECEIFGNDRAADIAFPAPFDG